MRVVSGIQPTGNLHLGNYLGAIRRWVRMQHELECLIFLADLHSLSEHIPAAERKRNVHEMAASLIACGIDPDVAILYNQARIPAHAELCWLLNGTARMGWLNRMTQWKDKAGKNREGASVALFDYPVLQAADVLLYQATHVPVGEDQKQHLELARDIAQKFNNDFNAPDFFPLTEPLIFGPATRVMSLRDGTKKMSKSDPSDFSRINLTDESDAIAQKIRRAKTDPHPMPETTAEAEKRPDADNLLGIYSALADKEKDAVVSDFAGKQFSEFKAALTELAVAKLGPIGAEMQRLMKDPGHVDAILRNGAERARTLAAPILAETYKIVGFLKP